MPKQVPILRTFRKATALKRLDELWARFIMLGIQNELTQINMSLYYFVSTCRVLVWCLPETSLKMENLDSNVVIVRCLSLFIWCCVCRMPCWLTLLAAMLVAAVWSPTSAAVVGRPPICVTEELTPQLRKVCDAYDAFSGLAETAQVYLQELGTLSLILQPWDTR